MERNQTNRSQGYGTLSGSDIISFKKISWGAIIAGVIIAIVLQLLLTLLGLGIGLGTINPMEESQPFKGLGTGTLIWWIVSMLISLFIAGWVVGRQSNLPEKFDRALNAILMWCLFTLLSFYIISSITSSLVRGAGNIAGKAMSAAGSGIKSVAPEAAEMIEENTGMGSAKDVMDEVKQVLRQTGKEDLQPENIEQSAESAGSKAMQDPQQIDELVNKLFGKGNDTFDDADKEALVNVVQARTGKSEQEAEAQVDNWIATYQKTKAQVTETKDKVVQQAKETGEEVASAASKIGIFSFIGLVLGALASAFGSSVAKPVYDIIDVPAGSRGSRTTEI